MHVTVCVEDDFEVVLSSHSRSQAFMASIFVPFACLFVFF